ncbi:MAG: zf-HC2 domain-containing protein [Acidobacteria bacterium]|nr:zf-HC2 domain-containing protein [Acidobacteriota bacterium]
MECYSYQEKVSNYIDNLLLAPERQQVENHLSNCPLCDSFYQDLLMICEASRNLPEYEPSETLWPSIRAQISTGQARMLAPTGPQWVARWFPFKGLKPGVWLWQPALAATLLLVGIAAIMYYRPSTQPPEPVAGGRWPSGAGQIEVQPTNRLIVHKPLIEVDLVQQRINELQKRIQAAQSRWSPEVQALYQQHLKMVDHCINNCQRQVAIQSDDPAVRAVYQSALRAKLEMLKQFSEM